MTILGAERTERLHSNEEFVKSVFNQTTSGIKSDSLGIKSDTVRISSDRGHPGGVWAVPGRSVTILGRVEDRTIGF